MKRRRDRAIEDGSDATPDTVGSYETSGQRRHSGPKILFLYEAVFVASFNMLNSWIVAWLFFHRVPIIPVWGLSGVVFNALPSSFVPAFLITIAGTLTLRQRLSRAAHQDPVSPSAWPTIAKLPTALWQRALVIALGSAIVTVLLTILCVTTVGVRSLDFQRFMETQMVQACILGLIVGPLVGARTLLEPVRFQPHLTP